MWYDFGGWGIFAWILMLLFWVGVIVLIVWGIKALTKGGGTTTKGTPLDIARERYAKGEISREEFEQIKKDLT
jgi:putative membrane protein